MTDTALGDFFAKKKKKQIKSLNLNVQATSAKSDTKTTKAKDAEDEGWEEEQVVETTMKVEVAGKLTQDNDKKEDEDNAAPAWAAIKKGESSSYNDRKYPTLAKSVQSSNINIDDGKDAKINIATNKNIFEALRDDNEGDEESKRPKEIKPAMVRKNKGEFMNAAVQREVDKYVPAAAKEKKGEESGDDEEDDGSDAEEKEKAAAKAEAKKKAKKAAKEQAEEEEKPSAQAPGLDQEEDTLIKPDLEAAREKYADRKRLPLVDLPDSELREKKPEKTGSKKKMQYKEEDTGEKKMAYWQGA